MLGTTESNHPQSWVLLLPRYIQNTPEHIFRINFYDWQVMKVTMDGIELQLAPIPSEVILIHNDIENIVSAHDLLRPSGTMPLEFAGNLNSLNGLILFFLKSHEYIFQLLVENGAMVFRRSDYEIRAIPEDDIKSIIWILWSPTELQLMLPANKGQKIWSVKTPISVAPKSLRQLARVKKLQPTTGFSTVEAFRTAVHEALCSLQDDLAESGAYQGFWDQKYQGKSKEKPTPKRETDIHRQILLPLYDWAKMRSVEIVPENETAVGKLDICFVGNVEGQGPIPFCVEVKLAHAQDLMHGLEIQLPEYMSNKKAMFGAYVVLWFKGTWFDLPATDTIRHLNESILPGTYEPRESECDELEFVLVTKTVLNLHLRNIRVFLFDVSKPISASKKKYDAIIE